MATAPAMAPVGAGEEKMATASVRDGAMAGATVMAMAMARVAAGAGDGAGSMPTKPKGTPAPATMATMVASISDARIRGVAEGLDSAVAMLAAAGQIEAAGIVARERRRRFQR